MTTETMVVQIAALKLCLRMGEAFKNKAEHGKDFDEYIDGILKKGRSNVNFNPI